MNEPMETKIWTTNFIEPKWMLIQIINYTQYNIYGKEK